MKYKLDYLKHFAKLVIRGKDPIWPFKKFEHAIHPSTWEKHEEILVWAENAAQEHERLEEPMLYERSEDPVVRQGHRLMADLKTHFCNKYRYLETDFRILIHIPNAQASMGGYSLFNNIKEGFEYLGVPVASLGWDEEIEPLLKDFRPTIFITSDHSMYLSRINWLAVEKYRQNADLKIGLTASLEEYGNTPLAGRLLWAKEKAIDFYYSFRGMKYINKRYMAFLDAGYPIISIPFGFNPLQHYPVPNIERDINYVFLASSNPDKWPRYFSYLTTLLAQYPGFLDGPGWSHLNRWAARDAHRYLYARAKVGVNLHINDSIDWASELNERTYILAACGVPQVVDNAKLLKEHFSDKCFFVADTPTEYATLFEEILHNPNEAQRRALQAQKEVFEKHTIFHRVEMFIKAFQGGLENKF